MLEEFGPGEFSEDGIVDELGDFGKRRAYHGDYAKFGKFHRYVEGELELHLHVWAGKPNPCDFCAVFKRAKPHTLIDGHGVDPNTLEGESYQIYLPVLVPVREILEHPKRMDGYARQVIQSVVRLQRVHHCKSARMHDVGGVNLVTVSVLSPDREANPLAGSLFPGLTRQLPRQTVQSASEIVDAVTNYDRESFRRSLFDTDAMDKLATVRLDLGSEVVGTRLEEVLNLPIQDFEVLVCPSEFEECRFKLRRNEVHHARRL